MTLSDPLFYKKGNDWRGNRETETNRDRLRIWLLASVLYIPVEVAHSWDQTTWLEGWGGGVERGSNHCWAKLTRRSDEGGGAEQGNRLCMCSISFHRQKALQTWAEGWTKFNSMLKHQRLSGRRDKRKPGNIIRFTGTVREVYLGQLRHPGGTFCPEGCTDGVKSPCSLTGNRKLQRKRPISKEP